MKVRFWLEDRGPRNRVLTIDTQLTHNRDQDQIYRTAYKLDVSEPIEMSMLYEILRDIERNTSKHAVDRTNLLKVDDNLRIDYLQEQIRHLDKLLRDKEKL